MYKRQPQRAIVNVVVALQSKIRKSNLANLIQTMIQPSVGLWYLVLTYVINTIFSFMVFDLKIKKGVVRSQQS